MKYDVVIVGAGAAGLMAAGTAAGKGKSVLVVEKMEKAGRKVRITGKGRCNLTNVCPADEFLSHIKANREFFEPSFLSFDNTRTVSFFRTEGLKLTVERGGRVFPESGKAWDVANALVDYATGNGAEIIYKTRVTGVVVIAGKVRGVEIITKKGYHRKVETDNVIIATGGMSYPSTGSTGDGYQLAHAMGHTIEEVRPSLVPLTGEYDKELMGQKLKNVAVSLIIEGQTVQEEFGEMEFGSRGLEGAVVLRISRNAVDAVIEEKNVAVTIDLKPALDREVLRERIARELQHMEQSSEPSQAEQTPQPEQLSEPSQAEYTSQPEQLSEPSQAEQTPQPAQPSPPVQHSQAVRSPQPALIADLVRKLTPRQLVIPVCRKASVDPAATVTSLTEENIAAIIETLKGFIVKITDYGSFEQAVVTAGGVSVNEIHSQTLESKIVKGLYFAGEIMDIDADTGGYNLQVAFSTGRVAGRLGSE